MSIGEVILVIVGAVLLVAIFANEWVRYERKIIDARRSKKRGRKRRK